MPDIYSEGGNAPPKRFKDLGRAWAETVASEPLSYLGERKAVAGGATSAVVELTATTTRVSIKATGADMRFKVGTSGVTATASSHFIEIGERLEFLVPENSWIAAIRNGTTDGVLEISELL